MEKATEQPAAADLEIAIRAVSKNRRQGFSLAVTVFPDKRLVNATGVHAFSQGCEFMRLDHIAPGAAIVIANEGPPARVMLAYKISGNGAVWLQFLDPRSNHKLREDAEMQDIGELERAGEFDTIDLNNGDQVGIHRLEAQAAADPRAGFDGGGNA